MTDMDRTQTELRALARGLDTMTEPVTPSEVFSASHQTPLIRRGPVLVALAALVAGLGAWTWSMASIGPSRVATYGADRSDTSVVDATGAEGLSGTQINDRRLQITLNNREGDTTMIVGSFAFIGKYNSDDSITELGQIRITPNHEYVLETETRLQAGTSVDPGEILDLEIPLPVLPPGSYRLQVIQDQPVPSSFDLTFKTS